MKVYKVRFIATVKMLTGCHLESSFAQKPIGLSLITTTTSEVNDFFCFQVRQTLFKYRQTIFDLSAR
jgi:hypothetical protein